MQWLQPRSQRTDLNPKWLYYIKPLGLEPHPQDVSGDLRLNLSLTSALAPVVLLLCLAFVNWTTLSWHDLSVDSYS